MVVGIPDAIVFDEGKPQLVFDRKTTSIPGRLFKNQRLQVWLYGHMVDSLGFETDELELAILAHEQHLDPSMGKDLQRSVISGAGEYNEGLNQLVDDPEAILYWFEYDPTDHLEDLNWALEYWRGDRDPKPTSNEAKCRSCPFSDICSDSLV